MATCGICSRELTEDPNELEDIITCAYCDMLFCSAECAAEHAERAHPGEAVPAAGEEEEERR